MIIQRLPDRKKALVFYLYINFPINFLKYYVMM